MFADFSFILSLIFNFIIVWQYTLYNINSLKLRFDLMAQNTIYLLTLFSSFHILTWILGLLLLFHGSPRFCSFYSIIFSVNLDRIISIDLSLSSLTLYYVITILLLSLSSKFLVSVVVFLSCKISIWFFFLSCFFAEIFCFNICCKSVCNSCLKCQIILISVPVSASVGYIFHLSWNFHVFLYAE